MRNSGYIVDLSDCRKEAIEIVLQLFKNNHVNVPQKLILDVYRVLVKLKCYFLEKKFYTYINQSMLMRGANNNDLSCLSNNQLSPNYYNIEKDKPSVIQLKELTSGIKIIQQSINDFATRKKKRS